MFKLLRSPRIDSKEPIQAVCSLTGRYDNPIPTRFLAPKYCLKIPAPRNRHNLKKTVPQPQIFLKMKYMRD
jgi:hypothetical protein